MDKLRMRSCGLAVIRVVVGIIFLMHGYQKLFKFGFHGVAGMFAHMGVPLPAVAAVVVTLVEFFGGLALIAGMGTRVAAILLAIDMASAIFFVHAKNGFFNPMGIEFPMTLLASCICLMLAGAGSLSIDGIFNRKV
ncbi:MAG: DoxX family protein [Terriglobales bacterium]